VCDDRSSQVIENGPISVPRKLARNRRCKSPQGKSHPDPRVIHEVLLARAIEWFVAMSVHLVKFTLMHSIVEAGIPSTSNDNLSVVINRAAPSIRSISKVSLTTVVELQCMKHVASSILVQPQPVLDCGAVRKPFCDKPIFLKHKFKKRHRSQNTIPSSSVVSRMTRNHPEQRIKRAVSQSTGAHTTNSSLIRTYQEEEGSAAASGRHEKSTCRIVW